MLRLKTLSCLLICQFITVNLFATSQEMEELAELRSSLTPSSSASETSQTLTEQKPNSLPFNSSTQPIDTVLQTESLNQLNVNLNIFNQKNKSNVTRSTVQNYSDLEKRSFNRELIESISMNSELKDEIEIQYRQTQNSFKAIQNLSYDQQNLLDLEPSSEELTQFFKNFDEIIKKYQTFENQFKLDPTKKVFIKIYRDIRPQFAEIYVNDQYYRSYWVSTGLGRRRTPAYKTSVKVKLWDRLSMKYKSTMTGALMISPAIGIHMTPAISQLGKQASHGCIRMEDAGVYKIWELTKNIPVKNILVHIVPGPQDKKILRAPPGLAPYQGGKPQRIESLEGRPQKARRQGVLIYRGYGPTQSNASH